MIKIVKEYRTVKGFGTDELVEKRSRFIANVKPVKTEQEAIDFINENKQKYWDARHNVYAYIIRENNIMRYSDDGEPSGTAGVPVLDMLKKEELCDVVVVVTRYFGGILLGTGGLVHAYSSSAKLGLLSAGIKNMILCREFMLSADYSMSGKVQYEISEFSDIYTGETAYGELVKMQVFVPVDLEDAFEKRIIDKTNANISIEKGEIKYFAK